MKEKQLKQFLKQINGDIMDTEDNQYCSYDLETKKSLLELKCRPGDRKFPDTLIEKHKVNVNVPLSNEKDKDFIYVVYSEAHQQVFFFNVSQLQKEGYDFKWQVKKLPATSEFSRRTWVDKEVGYIAWNKAYASVSV